MDYYDVAGYKSDDMHYFDVYVPSVVEVWESCMRPSIVQIVQYMATFFLWNIAFRLTSQTVDIPRSFQHIASIVCGMAISYFTLGLDALYSLGFTTITYLLFVTITQMNLKYYGFTLTFFCLVSLTIGEILDTDVSTWHRMRGTQMIAAMKIISIGFDIDCNKIKKPPDFLEFWGYILCPGNVVMGPWASYNEYLLIYQRPKWTFKWILDILSNAVLAIFFLLASNCLISGFIPDLSFTWAAAYKSALSYRCSHYFICFLSHCTMLLAGFGSGTGVNTSIDSSASRTIKKSKDTLGYIITKPWIIEFPRSLVDVVVYWNLSMHDWLHTYIFKGVQVYGIFKAVLSTYIISSLLHGVNIQLAAVLLSLGLATFCEHTLRKKVSDIYNACILARPCRDNCKHRYRSNNFYVIAFNFAFGLLAVFHLSYLGVMFDGQLEQQEIGYSFEHITDRWGALNYLSHWLILITYGISALI